MNELFQTTLTMIPARGGSKGIKDKNIKEVAGKPLIYYTLDICKELKIKPFVSTDSSKIIDSCCDYGLKVEYVRPLNLAQDNSNIYDCIIDAIKWEKENNSADYDNVMLLQPTNPIRKKEWIIDAFKIFNEKKVSSLASVSPMREHPLECIEIDKKNHSWKYLKKHKSKYNGRQEYDDSNYFIDGSIYICSIDFLLQEKCLVKENLTFPFIINQRYAIDIDIIEDLYIAESLIYLQKGRK